MSPRNKKRLAFTRHAARRKPGDVHTIPTPRLGGLGMFAGIAVGLLIASRLPTLHRVFQTSEARGALAAERVLVVGKVKIVGYIQIEPSISVEIKPCCAGSPSRIAHPGAGGHINKRSVAAVAIELIRAEVCD